MLKFASAVLLAGSVAATPTTDIKIATSDPDLAVTFINAVEDVCFQTAQGRAPTRATAGSFLLDAVDAPPSSIRQIFPHIPTWFRVQTKPENILVGVGDRPNACHVILADTTQTVEVQKKVTVALGAAGFRAIRSPALDSTVTDLLFAKQGPDGYLLVALQGPTSTVRGGKGAQAEIHVNLMPKGMFEAMLSRP